MYFLGHLQHFTWFHTSSTHRITFNSALCADIYLDCIPFFLDSPSFTVKIQKPLYWISALLHEWHKNIVYSYSPSSFLIAKHGRDHQLGSKVSLLFKCCFVYDLSYLISRTKSVHDYSDIQIKK